MPFDGAKVFQRVHNWVTDAANSVKISAPRMDAEFENYKDGLSATLLRDGSAALTGDLAMGGFKLTNMGVATSGTDAMSRDAADARYSPSTPNLIINGDFDIWQRGVNTVAATGFGADRWRVNTTGSSSVDAMERITHALGDFSSIGSPKYFARMAVTSLGLAASANYLAQRIENVSSYAGKTITVLAWLKKNGASQNPYVMSAVQHFGTGGSPSPNVTIAAGPSVPSSSIWTQVKFTISIPSVVGKTLGTNGNDYLELRLWNFAGSDFNAEVGAGALPFGGLQSLDINCIHPREGDVPATAAGFYRKKV
ncbi:MAG: hypothetical protein ACRCU5_16575, partial [Rhizobiaceae bacterium]